MESILTLKSVFHEVHQALARSKKVDIDHPVDIRTGQARVTILGMLTEESFFFF